MFILDSSVAKNNMHYATVIHLNCVRVCMCACARTQAVWLHGGPGGGSKHSSRRFFDPAVYRIVLFDQRGSGAWAHLLASSRHTDGTPCLSLLAPHFRAVPLCKAQRQSAMPVAALRRQAQPNVHAPDVCRRRPHLSWQAGASRTLLTTCKPRWWRTTRRS